MFLVAAPFALWLAYDFRQDEPVLAAFTLGLALVCVVVGAFALRRAARYEGGDSASSDSKKNHKLTLLLLALGWVAFGVVFGLLQDNVAGFVASLVPAAITASMGVYLWRRGG